MSAGEHGVNENEWSGILSKRAALKGFSSKNPLAMIEELRLLDQSRPLSGTETIAKYCMSINLKEWEYRVLLRVGMCQ